MTQQFSKKNGKVIVIDSSGPVRLLLADLVKSKGFSNVQGLATIKDALGNLEVEDVRWIITPLQVDQEINGLQLLRLIKEQAPLRHTRVSFLVEQDEHEVLVHAYEMGLMSHFAKPFNKESLTQALDDFFTRLAKYDDHDTVVAASYLRELLRSQELYDAALSLDRGLLHLLPGHLDTLLEMAKTQKKLGNAEGAKKLLQQAQLLEGEQSKRVEEVSLELFGQKHLSTPQTGEGDAPLNALGLSCCVVIDPDEASRRAVVKILAGLGTAKVIEFEDGDTAWQWLSSNPEPDLVIHEWRIPRLTGPLLLQRLRKKNPCLPIVTVSSLITPQDTPLVKEMGVAAVVPKPIDANEFLRNVIYVIQQDRLPTDTEVLESKIRRLLEMEHIDEAIKLYQKYQDLPHVPSIRKKKIEAEFAYVEQNYTLARDLTVTAIKHQADSIVLLNFLGKCLMKLKDYGTALRCFEKAQTLSPMNIERLCAIAEANSELGEMAKADAALERAKSVDQHSETVAETEASLSVSRGQTERAKEIMGKLSSLNNIISYLNNKAVAYARSGEPEEGIKLYEQSLASIPEDKKATAAIVRYNLALACVRLGQLEAAREHLRGTIELGESKVYTKSQSLLKRVERALNRQEDLHLNDNQTQDPMASTSGAPKGEEGKDDEQKTAHHALLVAIEASPGDLCCYRLFINPLSPSERVAKLLQGTVHFVQRKTIERSSVGGLEKSMKSAG